MMTMKYKTNELTGALLDLAVAKAEGLSPIPDQPVGYFYWVEVQHGKRVQCSGWYDPSSHGGTALSIIDREMIELKPWRKEMRHIASWTAKTLDGYKGDGHTAIIAAMRAYVASKFGEEVELP